MNYYSNHWAIISRQMEDNLLRAEMINQSQNSQQNSQSDKSKDPSQDMTVRAEIFASKAYAGRTQGGKR